MNLGYIISRSARMWADRVALQDDERKFTYAQLDERTNRLANALINVGVEKGERVAVLAWNRCEIAEVEVALLKAAMVRVPINARLSDHEVSHVCEDSQVKVLICDAGHEKAAKKALAEVDSLTEVWVMGQSLDKILQDADKQAVCVDVSLEDHAVHHYTSGSSGVLKAAIHTVGNRMASLRKITYRSRLHVDLVDTFLHVGPITHVSGMALMPTLAQGHRNIIKSRFDAVDFLETVEREKVTQTYLVPTMINRVLAEPGRDKFDLSSLRLLRYGAAPISPARLKEAVAFFGPILNQGYGAGETTSSVTMLTEADHVKAINGREELFSSCGRPLFDTEVRIVDDLGNECPIGESGELVIKGPDVMKGYWNAPELTEPVLKDGIYHTGDVAYQDDEGYIFIIDRMKDMIVTGGFNVYPSEVEKALFEHPAVYEACVVGVPDEDLGEAVKAVVVLKEGEQVEEEALLQHCVNQLGKFKKPHSVDFSDDLPKNDAGKLLRRAVRDQYWSNSGRNV